MRALVFVSSCSVSCSITSFGALTRVSVTGLAVWLPVFSRGGLFMPLRQFGLMVTLLGTSTKLLSVEPG